jgi:hypothetical protein
MLHVAGKRPLVRDRPSEFIATGTLDSLRVRYADWLEGCREVLEEITADRLAERFVQTAGEPFDWSIAQCIVHAVEHTAVHVGHLHIQRQIWKAEHAIG